MKTVLVTGAAGQLGSSLRARAFRHPSFDFLFTDVDTLDICDAEAVLSYMQTHEVAYVLNCAAYTAVDKAEDDEDRCMRINSEAVRNLGIAAARTGARIIHISTDYVFDGMQCRPYVETDDPRPVSAYGRTKLAGEKALQEVCPDAVVVRTAWLYSEYGNNFVKTMLRLGKELEEIRVVFDQTGTPTYAGDLADALLAILEKAETGCWLPGIYHFSDEGVCSWYDLTAKIMQSAGLPCRIVPIETREYPTRAVRPCYSVLNKGKIKSSYGIVIPHWETSLWMCLDALRREE